MAVGEIFLSAFIQVLFERLVPRDLSFFPHVVPELQKWKKQLLKVEAVLADAEEKKLRDKLVKTCLDDLRDLAYDLEDLLDELGTEELERKLLAEQNNVLADAGKAFMFYTYMKSNMADISSRLEQLWEEKDELGLIKNTAGGTSSTSTTAAAYLQRPPPTTCVPTEQAVYGRDEDAAKILEMVLSDDQPNDANFRAIPIIGMEGIGKTTLARKVYNDEAVKNFNIKAWVCVSDDFDVLRISKAILESITGRPCDLKDLNAVQVQLKHRVAGKKFLLVLDDVWSDNYSYWEILRSPFMAGARGSSIIVTTRLTKVALTINPSAFYALQLLSHDDCWSLFVSHAFGCKDIATYSNVDLIRHKVVEKCKGLPLAAKTLGGLLRSKQREDEWLDMLNSRLWELSDESEIPAALKLSYHHLPSHLKRCFAYCAVFSKNYEFKEEEVVLLWMAEGLIQQSTKNKQPEKLGSNYFHDLLSRSIFQQSSNNVTKYIMHDLVHELAQWVYGEIVLSLDYASGGHKQPRELGKVRHFSYTADHFDGKNKFEVLREATGLRTFLAIVQDENYTRCLSNIVLSDLLPKLKRLRALSLETYYITELPNSIEGGRHMQYLNLSCTMIKSLPESVSSLYNLQVLMLRKCFCLVKLPSDFGNLINLRHLDIRGANLVKEMPLRMKELKFLQKLFNFIVGKGIGSELKDLKSLKFLRGKLYISRLNNMIDFGGPRDLLLRDNRDLKELLLEWESQFDDYWSEEGAEKEKNVLDMLRPHQNLEKLTIRCYGGTRFPSWVGDESFSNIRVLKLESCKNCKLLPSLGLLGLLQDLTVIGMKGLKCIGSELYGEDGSKPFQSLEILCFEDLQEWEHWEPIKDNQHNVQTFPCLRNLSIINCPKLSGQLPDHLPSLEKLVIKNCERLVVSISSIPMLCELEIDGCKGVTSNSRIHSLSLNSITLSNISEFDDWLRQENFQKLECLNMKNMGCDALVNMWQLNGSVGKPPQEIQSFTFLRELCIVNCSNLVSFPEICLLTYLSKLEIKNCNALVSLPAGMEHNAHLKSMKIEGCDSLTFIVRGKLPSSLKSLHVRYCYRLVCLLDDRDQESCTSSSIHMSRSAYLLEYIHVHSCPALTCISSSGQLPTTLKNLFMVYCSQLTMLSTSGQLPKTLCSLFITDVPKLESISERFHNDMSLEHMWITDCENLKSLPEGLHNLSRLQEIRLWNCSSIDRFPEGGLPNTSLSVSIINCKKLEALPNRMHSLNSFQQFEIKKCPSIKSFPEEGFPTNLTALEIEGGLTIYKPLVEWGLHNLTSLTYLKIIGCPDAESFPQQDMGMMLPHSLTHLCIERFPELKYLWFQALQNLTSLELLRITGCPNLTFFPEQSLPSSLLRLHIRDCPLLEKQCRRNKGKDWSIISHIPCVEIDFKFIGAAEEEK
ncbi:hypothetical protein ACOSQ2_030868 [Xanthoceras sorbifolium]